MNLTLIKLAMKFLAGAAMLGVLVWMTWANISPANPLYTLCLGVLGALVGHLLSDNSKETP